MGTRLGTVFVDFDLNFERFTRSERRLYKDATAAAANIEKNFKNLGIKSEAHFELMFRKTNNAYKKLTGELLNSGNITAKDLINIEAAKAERIKAINAELNKVEIGHWRTLGIQSKAMYAERKAEILSAAQFTQSTIQKGSSEWARIEKAKNDRLKQLNKEMVGDHEMSMAAMMRAVLRLYAAYYVISNAIRVMVVPFTKGFSAVEQFNTSVAEMAAMVMSFSKRETGEEVADHWNRALKYSSAIVPVLEQIAAKTLLSGQETTALANAFARSGVFLNANNKKQVEGFTRLSNALPLMTRGQEIMRQINTEVRSLMNGTNEQSSQLLITLKAIDPEISKNLKTWREEGTVLENIGKLLQGFGPATSLLELQWQAVKSTLDTTVTQILRGSMADAYSNIMGDVRDLNKLLEENKEKLIDWGKHFGDQLEHVSGTLKTISGFIVKIMALNTDWENGMEAAANSLYNQQWLYGVRTYKVPNPPEEKPSDAPSPIPGTIDLTKYTELIQKLKDEYSLIGKSEVAQKALNAAREAGVFGMPEKYQVILSWLEKIDAANKAWKQSEAIKKLNEDLSHQAELIGKSEAEQQALNFAWQNGIEAGSEAYNRIYNSIENLIQKQREYNENLSDAKTIEDFRNSLVGWVDETAESLKGEEEKIRESYDRRKEMLRSALASGIIDYQKYSEMIIGLNKSMANEITQKEKTMSEELSDAIKGWASNWSSALNDMVWQADVSFGEILTSFAKMLTQMMIQKKIVEPFLDMDWSNVGSSIMDFFKNANGNAFDSGKVIPFARGGVVTSPTVFPMAKGMGLMGEAGPEAVMPLTRTSNGELGVKAQQAQMTVNVYEAPGTKATVEQSSDGMSFDVIIERIENKIANRARRGTGLGPFLDTRYARAM